MSLVPYRRGGFRGMGDPSINATTFWTPSTGYLNVVGDPSQGYQFKPQVTSVYDVPGLLLPAPACVQANAGAFVSASCVDQALAVEQQNFQRTAEYNAGTLKLPLASAPLVIPPTTPPKQITAIDCHAGYHPNAAGTSCDIDTPAGGDGSGGGSGSGSAGSGGGGYVDSAASFFENTYDIGGFNIPVWGLAAAAVAALLLMRGR